MALANLVTGRIYAKFHERFTKAELGVIVAGIARTRHKVLIDQGLVSAKFQTFVDGNLGLPEEAINIVQPGGGEIRYVGTSISAAVEFCFAYCRSLSPLRSGAFWRSWIVVVDGQLWQRSLKEIGDADAREIFIVNFAPYSRKLEQTVGKTRPVYRITAAASKETSRRFPGINARRIFITIPSGVSSGRWKVPYYTEKGQMTYPAVVITIKGLH